MTRRFDRIDLSRLPPPEVLRPLDFEAELADRVADFKARWPEFSAALESEPAMALLQAFAYRVTVKTAEFNDHARGLLLSHAWGGTLDHLAAHMGTARHLVDPGDPEADPPVAPVHESDDSPRARAQLAWEALSTAGRPEGAYVYHALAADPRVADVDASSPAPGEVRVAVLSTEGDGTAAPDLLAAVAARLNADNVRLLTDRVTAVSAGIVAYAVAARLRLGEGPGPEQALAAAARVRDYAARQRKLGRAVTRSALLAALHVEGVLEADLTAPAATLAPGRDRAAVLTDVTLTRAGN